MFVKKMLGVNENLREEVKKEAKKIIFKTHHLGTPLDNLTRDDFYEALNLRKHNTLKVINPSLTPFPS